jgi:hypothetical protein
MQASEALQAVLSSQVQRLYDEMTRWEIIKKSLRGTKLHDRIEKHQEASLNIMLGIEASRAFKNWEIE